MPDDIDRLRSELARHSGPARTRPLIELSRALTNRYWRDGIGSDTPRPFIDEAIERLEEAYGYLLAGEFARGRVAALLGTLVGQRHIVYFSSEDDRTRGIALLDEALGFPQLPPMLLLQSRLILGNLLLQRSLRRIQSPQLMLQVIRSGPSGDEKADLDRAVACLDRVIEDPASGPGIARTARTMRDSADAVRGLMNGLGGGPGGLSNLLSTLGPTVQKLNEMASAEPKGSGFGYLPNPFNFGEGEHIAQADPLTRPVFTLTGPTPTAGTAPPPPPDPEPPTPALVFREAFFRRLGGSGFESLRSVLEDRSIQTGPVDDLAALAGELVEAPGSVGTDHLLLAAALYLRALRDKQDRSGGWESTGDGPTDAEVATDELCTAVPDLLAEPADATVTAHHLATLLDESFRPAPGAGNRLDKLLGSLTTALRAVGVDALLYPSHDAGVLLTASTGRLTAIEPDEPLPPRLLVVGEPPMPTGSVVSFVSSGQQLVDLAGRARRPLTDTAVFVANPRGDRQQASIDAMVLRRTFHPRSQGLGQTVENVDGVGTAAEVSTRLDASLLHLGCGISADGGLELADREVLTHSDIAAGPPSGSGGLAILPPSADGVAALTRALLACRFRDVITVDPGVSDSVTSLLYFQLHRALIDDRLDPARAVAEVRRWLADPDREPPDNLPPWYTDAANPDLTDLAATALSHHGV